MAIKSETSQRIIDGIQDEGERRAVTYTVDEAMEILVAHAEKKLRGPLGEDAKRRLMNAIGPEYTT